MTSAKVTPAEVRAMKARAGKIPALTAYDYPTTRLLDECGVPLVLVGVKRIDPRAAHRRRGFRLLIIPGTIFLWPLLARRWWSGVNQPPEENNAHRGAARGEART